MAELPMFPLGTVLFPTLVLPLHVFEPRYRVLVERCLGRPEPEFGVVLIERGSEVGGHDVRSSIGTVARIVDSKLFDDGRWALAVAVHSRTATDKAVASAPRMRIPSPPPGPLGLGH